MRQYLKYIIVLALMLFSLLGSTLAQSANTIDSLQQILTNAQTVKEKIYTLHNISKTAILIDKTTALNAADRKSVV